MEYGPEGNLTFSVSIMKNFTQWLAKRNQDNSPPMESGYLPACRIGMARRRKIIRMSAQNFPKCRFDFLS